MYYNGLPPIKSDQRLTSDGMPLTRGSFSLMQRAKSSAVCTNYQHHLNCTEVNAVTYSRLVEKRNSEIDRI